LYFILSPYKTLYCTVLFTQNIHQYTDYSIPLSLSLYILNQKKKSNPLKKLKLSRLYWPWFGWVGIEILIGELTKLTSLYSLVT